MAAYFLVVAALICQASAQIYNGAFLTQPLLQPLKTSPVLPISQIVPVITQFPRDIIDIPLTTSFITNPTPVISTTVVDNSVASSLANVLQLLIVSDLIESTLPPPISPLLSNVAPFYDAIGPIADLTSISYSPVVDVSTVTDVIASTPINPVLTSVVAEVISPVPTYQNVLPPVAEVSSVSTYTQNVYAPITEAVAPIPEVLTPVISTVTEVTSSVSATADVYTAITDSISPASYYVNEATEIVAPVQLSLAPTPVSYISDYYSGYADVITPVPTTVPFAAELILPKSIPAQIVCNFGYSPVNVPVFSMNVEPLPEGCVF